MIIGKTFFAVMTMLFLIGDVKNFQTNHSSDLDWVTYDRFDTAYTLYFDNGTVYKIDTLVIK